MSHYILQLLIYVGKSDFQEYAVTKTIALNLICWFETVSEDEESNFKRLNLGSKTKCSEPF